MITISDLIVYPVKSCKGIHLKSAVMTKFGIKHDRQWMIVDQTGYFVTQREQPRLAFVTPTILATGLQLEAPGMEPIMIPLASEGPPMQVEIFGETMPAPPVDPAIDQWLSEYLGGAFRLVAFDPDVVRRGGVQYPTRDASVTMFPDNYALLVVSKASLDDLNRRLNDPVPMNRFRPNIVVDGTGEYEEDFFAAAASNGVSLRFINLCYRCNFTTIDQETANIGPEPLQTLGLYRYDEAAKGIKFGSYATVEDGVGRSLRANDVLDVQWNF